MYKRFLAALLTALMIGPAAASADASTPAPLPATYEFTDHWPAIPMYDQEGSPACGLFSTFTAMSALVETQSALRNPNPTAYKFPAWAVYKAMYPHHDEAVGNEEILTYLQQHPVVAQNGTTWRVTWWRDITWPLETAAPAPLYWHWDIDGIKRALLTYHVLVATIGTTPLFDGGVMDNPIDATGGKWDYEESGHSIAMVGWSRHGFIFQNTWGNFGFSPKTHEHSRWVVTYRYWRKYAAGGSLYAFKVGEVVL
jgi:hypothetical protein